jgi:hypothetical protein
MISKDIEINRLDNQILVRALMKNGENYNTSRRFFCKTVGLALQVHFTGMSRNSGSYSFVWHQSYLGAPIAHQNPNQPSKFIFLFVGGGISGMVLAIFKRNSYFLVVELENHLGEIIKWRKQYSKYPLEPLLTIA